MKGVINVGIQTYIIQRFGDDAWKAIRQNLGIDEPVLRIDQDYDDSLTLSLIAELFDLSEASHEQVMRELSDVLLNQVLWEHYSEYFLLAGSDPREFLLNMDRIHNRVTHDIPNSLLPKFEYSFPATNVLHFKYKSERHLCQFCMGLIEAVGLRFNTQLEVKELECQNQGADFCLFEITFPD